MIQVKFADFVIEDVRSWRPSRKNKLSRVALPRRHGTLIADVAFSDELLISLEGEVWKPSETELRDYFANLGARLLNMGKDRLYLRDDGRFLYAICTGTSFPQFDAQRSSSAAGAAFSLEFTAGDPFWYSGTEQQHLETIGTTPFNFSVSNNGLVRTPVRVQFTPKVGPFGSATDLRLTNTTTGLAMRYRGSVVINQTLIIDAERASVQNNGVNDINQFEGAFWLLEPGINNLTYAGPNGSLYSIQVDVFWRERFID
jgi:hypothetical protein